MLTRLRVFCVLVGIVGEAICITLFQRYPDQQNEIDDLFLFFYGLFYFSSATLHPSSLVRKLARVTVISHMGLDMAENSLKGREAWWITAISNVKWTLAGYNTLVSLAVPVTRLLDR